MIVVKKKNQKHCATRTQERRKGCKSGLEEYGYVLVEEDIQKCGNHYTSKYNIIINVNWITNICLQNRSEGPAQVFLLTLTWLMAKFADKKREDWKEITLSYDNMCYLDNLKVTRKELPLPGQLKYIWSDINKIIDTLHIKNHVDKRCQMKYNPDVLKETNPSYNTMVCEQTFAWLSRYKRIVASMPKTHHHFYLHRMIKTRNAYISLSYQKGQRPIHSCKIK